MVSKVSANFGSDQSPRHPRKYKKSALFVAKSLRGNFNSNFRCAFHRHSSRAKYILFEHIVTLPGGKPEVAIEAHSSKLAFLRSLFRVKHAFEFALILHCYARHLHPHARYLHYCARFTDIVIPPCLICVVAHVFPRIAMHFSIGTTFVCIRYSVEHVLLTMLCLLSFSLSQARYCMYGSFEACATRRIAQVLYLHRVRRSENCNSLTFLLHEM